MSATFSLINAPVAEPPISLIAQVAFPIAVVGRGIADITEKPCL